jgi:hypothetical protein
MNRKANNTQETIEKSLSRLSTDDEFRLGVEEAAKQGKVLPILSDLGWL